MTDFFLHLNSPSGSFAPISDQWFHWIQNEWKGWNFIHFGMENDKEMFCSKIQIFFRKNSSFFPSWLWFFEALVVIVFPFYLEHFFGFYSRCRWWKVRWLNWKWTGDRTRGMRAWRPASVPALRTAAAPSPFSGRQCRCSPVGCRRFLRKCRGLSRPPHLPKRDERFGNSCTFNLTKVQMSANGTKTWTNQSTNQSMQ